MDEYTILLPGVDAGLVAIDFFFATAGVKDEYMDFMTGIAQHSAYAFYGFPYTTGVRRKFQGSHTDFQATHGCSPPL
jgi:hypothetical protein